MTLAARVALVVPTVGRPTLARLLDALAASAPGVADVPAVVLVDDRRDRRTPLLAAPVPPALEGRVRVVAGHAAGPAAARNVGWRSTSTEWVAFLDDDVEPPPGWLAALEGDLDAAGPEVAAVQGRIRVPLPTDRRPTDWERNVAGLEGARWATADMAFRRGPLVAVGGFDERFPRAYREDAELALRLMASGWALTVGDRWVSHPVRPAPWHVSLRLQRGNADDPLVRRLHGRGWRARAEVPRGRRARHVAVVGAAGVAAAGLLLRRPALAVGGAAAWLAGTAELGLARTLPGPRAGREVAAMVVTSLALPFAAVGWWAWGVARLPARLGQRPHTYPDAVLFDRDGTLVDDVPYNGDPAQVRLRPGAAEAVAELRRRGVAVGMVTNQSGVARGLLTAGQVREVNERVTELVGGLDVVEACLHGPDDGCECRKPAPGMVLAAARRLGAEPSRCVVIGDIGADVDAARAAGARGILVPTGVTRPEEVEAADEVAGDLSEAVAAALGETTLGSPTAEAVVDPAQVVERQAVLR